MAVLMVIVFNKVVNYKKEEDDGADDGGDDNPEPVIPNNENFEEYHIYMDDKPAKIEELTSDINEDYMNQIQKNIREDEVIEDDAVNEVVNDTVNEVEEVIEETVEEEVERFEDSVEGMIQNNKKEKVQMDAEEPVVEDDFVDEDEVDEDEVENTPEEQIEENIDEVNKLTREPIIPRGKIIKEDIIKEDRGFSVHIPDPEPKEEETPKQHFFQRKRTDELGDD
jgi:Mg2+ and Co2+ transporter CorA